MKRAILCATMIALSVSIADGADAKKKRATTPAAYTLTALDAEMYGPIDINNAGEVLIERQLEQWVDPAPLLLMRNRRRASVPFQCPGTTNDTIAEDLNNNAEVVGHCGHQPGELLVAFVANLKTGVHALLSVPGSTTTWGYGINDAGDVVGIYTDQLHKFHSFYWLKATGEYRTIHNPLADQVGGFTWLRGINKNGQIIGYYTTAKAVPWEEFQFVYSNGTFLPIVFPGASQTHALAINNLGQVLGWYSGAGCPSQPCLFLYDDNMYFAAPLPLPANEPRPDGMPAGTATLIGMSGLNDKAQFTGSYYRILEWNARDHLGNIAPSKIEVINFIATPK